MPEEKNVEELLRQPRPWMLDSLAAEYSITEKEAALLLPDGMCFDSDESIISREVFSDRKVVRWDFITFEIVGDSLVYSLNKLEFRDLNDNWLNALQGFDNIPPEIYRRDVKGTAEMKQPAEKKK